VSCWLPMLGGLIASRCSGTDARAVLLLCLSLFSLTLISYQSLIRLFVNKVVYNFVIASSMRAVVSDKKKMANLFHKGGIRISLLRLLAKLNNFRICNHYLIGLIRRVLSCIGIYERGVFC